MSEKQCFSIPFDSFRLTDQNMSVDPQNARNPPCPFQASRLRIDCFASPTAQVPHACPRPKPLGMRVASSLQSDQPALRISFQTVAEPDAPISQPARLQCRRSPWGVGRTMDHTNPVPPSQPCVEGWKFIPAALTSAPHVSCDSAELMWK